MTKFLLGVTVGYVFNDVIDKLVRQAASTVDDKLEDTPTTEETSS